MVPGREGRGVPVVRRLPAEAVISLHGGGESSGTSSSCSREPGCRRVEAPRSILLRWRRSREEKLQERRAGEHRGAGAGRPGTVLTGRPTARRSTSRPRGSTTSSCSTTRCSRAPRGSMPARTAGDRSTCWATAPGAPPEDDRWPMVRPDGPAVHLRLLRGRHQAPASPRPPPGRWPPIPGTSTTPCSSTAGPGWARPTCCRPSAISSRRTGSSLNVVYVPLESVEEHVLESLGNKQGELRQEMERADLLLIDDLQFLSGKERLQDELLRVINQLIPTRSRWC